MKEITIATNGEFIDARIERDSNGNINRISFTFKEPYMYSDLEMWLSDTDAPNSVVLDYAKMNISKRNKMQFSK